MSDVFVSYKAEDRPRVRPLVEALEADGLSVWWDAHIGAGDEWRESIARNLDQARCVVVAWSKRSIGNEGRFVRDEAARAVKRGVYLPVTIDKVDPPLGFGETQCLSLSGWKGDRDDPRYLALLDYARRIVGGDRQSAPQARASARVDRRGVLAGGALVGAAAAGGGAWYWLHGAPAEAASVAVLPFANLSGDPAQAYFSDGLAEELRSSLARIPGLRVMARTSSEMLRDSDAKAAAAKLGVGTIVTGSVRRSPAMIRVSAQLIDGTNGLERWSQTFDRPPGDVLEVQTSIAESVAEQLRGQFGAADRRALRVGGTSKPEAEDLVLKANASRDGSRDGYRRTIAMFDAAIALDPGYADAYAGKAAASAESAGFYAQTPAELKSALADAASVAERSITLAPTLARGHDALATTRYNQLELRAAIREYERGFALPGGEPGLVNGFAALLSYSGLTDQALRVWQAAAARDPFNPDVLAGKANILQSARRYDEVIALERRILQAQPGRTGSRARIAVALLSSGKMAEAREQFAMLPPEAPTRFVGEAVLALRTGDKTRAHAILDSMRREYGDSGHYQYAEIVTQFGDFDAGLAELDAAWIARDPGLAVIRVDPLFDPLRNDPRFQALVARLDFPTA